MQSTQTSELATILDRFPSGDLIALFAIGMVFTTLFLIVLVVCLTRTFSAVRMASINAKMVASLTDAGHSADEIERIVKTASVGSRRCWSTRWQPGRPPIQGKPAAV